MKRLVLVCGLALAFASHRSAAGRAIVAQRDSHLRQGDGLQQTQDLHLGTRMAGVRQERARADPGRGGPRTRRTRNQKRESGPTDVLVTYASIRRTDVDVKSAPNKNDAGRAQYDVGTLIVLILEPGTRKELFRARVDRPISAEPEKLSGIINTAIADIFAKYPNRPRK